MNMFDQQEVDFQNKLDLLFELCSEAYLPLSDFAQRVNNISENFGTKESDVMSNYKAEIIQKYK